MITSPSLFLAWSLLMMQLFPGTRSWGKEGHFVICKIAEGLLSVDAAAAVKLLLPNESNGDLASTCSWADEIRYNRHWRWSSPLHYVDTPDYRCNYNYCRDCHDSAGHRDRCVSGAIYNYSAQLTTFLDVSSQLKYNLTEALMFLSHFMGDIHQPLHVGFTGDYGGNTIVVHWFRRKTNLHHVWDTMIIEEAVKKIYNSNLSMMVQALMRNISENWSIAIPTWENCDSNATSCPDLYASESVRFACKYAYRNATPGSTLSDDYFKSRLPVVEKRLAQSGVRLASTLNRILARHISIALE